MSSKFSCRLLSRSVCRVVAIGAMSIGLFWSCRTVDDEMVDGADTYQATLPDIGASYKIPQKAVWRIDSDSGEAGLYNLSQKIVAWVDLDTVPKDTVWIEYWRAGVREQMSAFLFKGTARLEWSGISLMDSLVVELLRRIDPSTDSSRLDTAFARALVDNDAMVRGYGFPKRFPTGLDSAKILRIAMLLMVEKELPLAQIAPKSEWALGIDTLSVHVRVRLLCEAGRVTDTSKIFPHPKVLQDTVRKDTTGVIKTDTTKHDSVKVDTAKSDTTAKDTTKLHPVKPDTAKSDTTAKDTSKTPIDTVKSVDTLPKEPYHAILLPTGTTVPFDSVSVLARWIVYDSTSPVDSVRIGGVKAVHEKDSTWSARVCLDSVGNPITIRFVAITSKGTVVVDSFKVTRLNDSVGPAIRFVSPTDKQAFEYTTDSVTLSVAASDPSGLASVKIGGVAVAASGGEYQRRVGLAMGETAKFEAEARDSAGNLSNASITITRKASPDTLPPRIQLVWPSQKSGTVVPFDSQSVTLRWVVSDNHKLSSVTINNVAITGAGGIFATSIALQTGKNLVVIAATDSTGNRSDDTVELVRIWKDTTRPVMVRMVGTGSRMIDFDSVSAKVSWKVTDNSPVKVTINEVEITGVGGIYTAVASLPGTVSIVTIVATDTTGNTSTDTVTITKSIDLKPPVLVPTLETRSQGVDNNTTSFRVGWKISDNGVLRAVSIAGQILYGPTDSAYTLNVPLDIGNNVILVQATDQAGNVARDSIVIHRDYPPAPTPFRMQSAVPTTYSKGWNFAMFRLDLATYERVFG